MGCSFWQGHVWGEPYNHHLEYYRDCIRGGCDHYQQWRDGKWKRGLWSGTKPSPGRKKEGAHDPKPDRSRPPGF